MKYKIWMMLIRLIRIFVCDFHAYARVKLYGGIFHSYEECFSEVWEDTEKYWDSLKEEKNE